MIKQVTKDVISLNAFSVALRIFAGLLLAMTNAMIPSLLLSSLLLPLFLSPFCTYNSIFQIHPSIHAGLRAFGRKIRKTVLPWMSKAKSAAKPHKRGFRLIFQAGGPAFLRSAALFPVVKFVEIYACQIDRLTKAQNDSKSNPQDTRG